MKADRPILKIIISSILIAMLAATTLPVTSSAAPASLAGRPLTNFHSIETVSQRAFSVKLLDASAVHAKHVTEDPVAVAASSSPSTTSPSFLSVSTFSDQVANGNSGQVTGIYAENLFALPVVQQPSGNAGFVSGSGNTATQFKMASALGFLAHNYLAGSLFFYLYSGAPISVVFGDGQVKNYVVSQMRKFQALSPDNPYSDFVDLASGGTLSATDLFYQTYGVSGQVVLQTCISSGGNSSWGRLFVIATPTG